MIVDYRGQGESSGERWGMTVPSMRADILPAAFGETANLRALRDQDHELAVLQDQQAQMEFIYACDRLLAQGGL